MKICVVHNFPVLLSFWAFVVVEVRGLLFLNMAVCPWGIGHDALR
jgi:hypothetical protein